MGQFDSSNDDLLRRTALTVAAMLGGSVAFVGALILLASLVVGQVVGRAVGAPSTETGGTKVETALPASHDAPATKPGVKRAASGVHLSEAI